MLIRLLNLLDRETAAEIINLALIRYLSGKG